MSAMRAEELPILPELPAALPQDSSPTAVPQRRRPSDTAVSDSAPSDTAGSDSARTRAAVRWTAPLDPPAPAPARPRAPSRPATRPRVLARPATRRHAPRRRTRRSG